MDAASNEAAVLGPLLGSLLLQLGVHLTGTNQVLQQQDACRRPAGLRRTRLLFGGLFRRLCGALHNDAAPLVHLFRHQGGDYPLLLTTQTLPLLPAHLLHQPSSKVFLLLWLLLGLSRPRRQMSAALPRLLTRDVVRVGSCPGPLSLAPLPIQLLLHLPLHIVVLLPSLPLPQYGLVVIRLGRVVFLVHSVVLAFGGRRCCCGIWAGGGGGRGHLGGLLDLHRAGATWVVGTTPIGECREGRRSGFGLGILLTLLYGCCRGCCGRLWRRPLPHCVWQK
mmetsp:Transcript_10698/g.30961  ORF Transcript_10698/g.30961 Transcript_10698/m.30961 type:complete len:278 (+) Transcript_10698:1438-2271(+)